MDENGNVYVGGDIYNFSDYTYRYFALKYSPGLGSLLWASQQAAEFEESPMPTLRADPRGGGAMMGNGELNPATASGWNSVRRISEDGAFGGVVFNVEQWGDSLFVDSFGKAYISNYMPAISIVGVGTVTVRVERADVADVESVYVDGENRIYFAGVKEWLDTGETVYYFDRYIQAGGQDTTAPATITDLAATDVSTDSITLSWTAAGDDGITGTAAGYDIRYTTAGAIVSDTDFGSATPVAGVPSPQEAGSAETFTITGLTPGTTYFFGIKTADEAGNLSGLSNSPKGITVSIDTTAPAAVTDLAVKNVSTSSITLSWTAPGDDGITGTAQSYDIRYTTAGVIISTVDFSSATQAQGEPTPKIAGSTETFTITGLTPATTYFFGLKTADEAGNVSGLSNSPKGITAAIPAEKYFIKKSTGDWQIVMVNTYTEPMVSLVNILGTTNPAAGRGIYFSTSTFPAGATGQELTVLSTNTDSNGLAETQLKLGNIPAEYGVTATCPSCVPEASSVTFTCCGKLPNDHFSQSGVPAWSYNQYARHTSTEPNTTIGFLGCGVTALATLSNYYAANISTSIPTTNPGILNTYLRGLPGVTGYDSANDVQFSAFEIFSSSTVHYIDDESASVWEEGVTRQVLIDRTNREILAGRPVILQIRRRRADNTFGPHFIVAVGKCGNNHIIADPIGGEERLYNPTDPNARLIGIRVFRP